MRPLRSRAPSLAAALALVPLLLPAQAPEGAAVERNARVDAIFAPWDRDDSPGCAVGVYRDGRAVHTGGYGMADLERRVPITPRTVFDIGSTGKQFSAASVALLAQRGVLSLDDDVRRWVPELPRYERPVTIRYLLHHTSGLRDYINLLTLGGARIDDVTTDDDALAAIARQRALNFLPGDDHLYSNSGFFLLSVIVERAAGMPLREFAQREIFQPLGMVRTHYLGSYDDVVPDRALAYAPRPDGGYRTSMSRWLQTGDGGVFTTVEELALWDRNFLEPRVGGPELLAELHRPGTLAGGRVLGYALGLTIGTHRGERIVSHGGSWGGYRAELMRFPDHRFSVAVLCNVGAANATQLAQRVAEIYLDDVLEAPAAAAAATPASAPAVRVPAATLRALAGTYRHPDTRATRTITFDGGTLYVGTRPRFELRPRNAREFDLTNAQVRASMTFEPATGGGPRRLVWQQVGEEPITFEEVYLVAPGAAALAAYAGAYHGEEIQAIYTLDVTDGALRLRRRGADPAILRPGTHDEFSAGGTTLRFQRDAAGEVSGFILDVGRVRNLHFVRTGG
jgi:CubicO group peptidase (beta-lactamase class C family)